MILALSMPEKQKNQKIFIRGGSGASLRANGAGNVERSECSTMGSASGQIKGDGQGVQPAEEWPRDVPPTDASAGAPKKHSPSSSSIMP